MSGFEHYRYQHGKSTKEAKAKLSEKHVTLRYLADLGNHVNLFHTRIMLRGRPPSGYMELDLTNPEQLFIAILKTLPKQK